MKFNCHHCGETASKPPSIVKRQLDNGQRIFCDMQCFREFTNKKAKSASERKASARDYRQSKAEQSRAYHRAAYLRKKSRPLVTQKRLLEVLVYSPESGVFTYRADKGRFKAGSIAGYAQKDTGRVSINVDGRLYRAHRLAWLYMTGQWPKNEIDHIDTNAGNNAWANLRDVTPTVNKQNMRKAQAGKKHSPLLGAQWCKQRNKWSSRIRVDGKAKHLGFFQTDTAASEAYIAAKRIFHEGCTI